MGVHSAAILKLYEFILTTNEIALRDKHIRPDVIMMYHGIYNRKLCPCYVCHLFIGGSFTKYGKRRTRVEAQSHNLGPFRQAENDSWFFRVHDGKARGARLSRSRDPMSFDNNSQLFCQLLDISIPRKMVLLL